MSYVSMSASTILIEKVVPIRTTNHNKTAAVSANQQPKLKLAAFSRPLSQLHVFSFEF